MSISSPASRLLPGLYTISCLVTSGQVGLYLMIIFSMQVFVLPDSCSWTTFLVRGLLCFFVHIFALFLPHFCLVLKINNRELRVPLPFIKSKISWYLLDVEHIFTTCSVIEVMFLSNTKKSYLFWQMLRDAL